MRRGLRLHSGQRGAVFVFTLCLVDRPGLFCFSSWFDAVSESAYSCCTDDSFPFEEDSALSACFHLP